MRRLLPALVTGVLVAVLLAPPAHAAVDTALPAGVSSTQLAAARAQILKDTNAARAQAGLPPLVEDSALDSISQSCSTTQAANSTMAHCSGYHYSYPAGWTWAAENVASGYAVHQVVAGWMGSAGHKANILRSDATHIGIGYATSSSGRTYFTQNFAAYPTSVRPLTGLQYYRTAYDGKIYRVDGSDVRALSWSEYVAAGQPGYRTAPTDYVRYAWSTSITALTKFGTSRSTWVWQTLSPAQWTAAGRPGTRSVPWIEGSTIHQWATSGDLFLKDRGGVVHKLTYAEWRATGLKPFTRKENQGFVRLSWDSSGAIAFLCDIDRGIGKRITAAQWRAHGNPTPKAVTRTTGDGLWWGAMSAGGQAINYKGAVLTTQLTYRQWQAMKAPKPASTAPATMPTTCG